MEHTKPLVTTLLPLIIVGFVLLSSSCQAIHAASEEAVPSSSSEINVPKIQREINPPPAPRSNDPPRF
ncbi:hypothetical protein ES319_D11G351500v1 [Gossypium barbadense]|uniref:Transmembrane protein n=2 Tax=Gossypium TaxID=3633 RepID=A0A5J5PMT1_GOSBA|nr:hypothetical protein ES319_D11G351500v1 [Gossypium barbadense]PPD68163.1 hypothetical protein GOBAR_DD34956 [Gossypium barbadense]TYG47794.1 hypothetical protein ES288_D11G370000v1 [Gossypium darwinii]